MFLILIFKMQENSCGVSRRGTHNVQRSCNFFFLAFVRNQCTDTVYTLSTGKLC